MAQTASALAMALGIERLIATDDTLRMLRSDNLAIAASLLAAHLGAPGARLPTDEVHERIDVDLEVLRAHFPLGTRTAKAYCDAWRNAGLLLRRPAIGARGETYELAPQARAGIQVIDDLITPPTTMTESRLVSLAAALRQLAIDSDPDVARRVDALRRERDRIDEEIERTQRGDIDVLDDRRAAERVADILLQAQDLPTDFARVRARFEELNAELRSSILNADSSQRAVLDDIFLGVDLIESSDEGKTFTAFAALLRDPERSAALDADVAAVLDRDFASDLSVEARRSLRTMVRELKHGSRDVSESLTEFARGLRRYVQSQAFQRDRVLRDALQEALAAAVPASATTRPYADTGIELELSAVRLSSVGELAPHDPAEFDTGAALADDEPGVVDFAALAEIARESEIDFTELVENVNAVVDAIGEATVGEVLEAYPATQGLASVIGLVSLATANGTIRRDLRETLRWRGTDGVDRAAEIDVHVFTGRIDG